MIWNTHETLIVGRSAGYIERSIAAFDMDGTIIKTKSGKRFPQNANDWIFFCDRVPQVLQELHKEGHSIAFISNQLGIGLGKVDANEIKKKIENIATALDIPIIALLATADDHLRKPRTGVQEFINQKFIFYCGDAAGRKRDFASSDYRFALNLGIPFKTPEALFLKSDHPNNNDSTLWDIGFDPRTIPSGANEFTHAQHQEIIVLCGPPASGKSSFANEYNDRYDLICQDILKTKAKCLKKCRETLSDSIIIDATNRDVATRSCWIEYARSKNIPIRCVVMDVEKPLAMHLNTYRNAYGDKRVPAIAIHMFFSKYEPPTIGEGFSEIITLPFRSDNADLRRFV